MPSQKLLSEIALLFVPGISLLHPVPAQGETITATGLSQAAVQTAVFKANDGDTVKLPAGTATWTTPVVINDTYITIVGAGIDKTTIVGGDYPQSTGEPTYRVFNITAKAGGLTRISGMTLDGGAGARDGYNKGMVAMSGDSHTWRIDHVRFRAARTCAMHVYASGGVIDHCCFDLIGWTFGIYGFNGGDLYGDAAWAEDAGIGGGATPFFVEDNEFTATDQSVALDGWSGERVVFRHNTLRNCSIADHGTESSGRWRGARSFEIYGNVITCTGRQLYMAIGLRSGTGVIFNNTITGDVKEAIGVDNFRDFDSFAPWGIASGESPFDHNDLGKDGKPVVYDTGTHTGSGGAQALSCSGKAWATDQWRGYSVHNVATGKSSIIVSNTSDTLVTRYDDTHGGPNLIWKTGDAFKIERCFVALDQAGRGKGKLITGDTPLPAAWPDQAQEPVYVWNNTKNGSTCTMVSGSPHIREGIDFYNGQAKPGYVPYQYPLPLAVK